jgi:SAM-dependent methyltransferase
MLTVDFERLGPLEGRRLLDLGCGAGRHAYEAFRRGAGVVAVDRSDAETKHVASMVAAMAEAGEAPAGAWATAVTGDALSLPFADASFDHVIASEVLEHVDDDGAAARELARVLRPGGGLAVTVPRWFPEQVCWALADDYHAPAVPGGHVRIFGARRLAALLAGAGLQVTASHHAHALHTPYWWLKCLVGVSRTDALPVRLYHQFLVWDIVRPRAWVRAAERALDPVLGKSLVVYAVKLQVGAGVGAHQGGRGQH